MKRVGRKHVLGARKVGSPLVNEVRNMLIRFDRRIQSIGYSQFKSFFFFKYRVLLLLKIRKMNKIYMNSLKCNL